jgi:hypothetical protein
MALIRAHGKDPAAFEGILVLVDFWFLEDDLVQLVLEHHLANPKMGKLCFAISFRANAEWVEKILKETAAKHPQQAVRGQAMYALGDYYRYRAQPPGGGERSDKEKAKYFAESARCFTEVTKKYADAPMPDGRNKLGDKAAAELARIRNIPNLKIGKVAPQIAGEDLHGDKLRLSDYRGKVVLLDFWGNW